MAGRVAQRPAGTMLLTGVAIRRASQHLIKGVCHEPFVFVRGSLPFKNRHGAFCADGDGVSARELQDRAEGGATRQGCHHRGPLCPHVRVRVRVRARVRVRVRVCVCACVRASERAGERACVRARDRARARARGRGWPVGPGRKRALTAVRAGRNQGGQVRGGGPAKVPARPCPHPHPRTRARPNATARIPCMSSGSIAV